MLAYDIVAGPLLAPSASGWIKEAMRLFPPAWGVGREAVRDCEVGGYHVPKGTQALMITWVVHRDPRWFEEPEAFRTDRWDGDRDAVIDGAGYWKRAFLIVLPLSRRIILLATLVSAIGSMLAFDQFYIMTSGGPRGQTFTAVYWIYQNSFVSFRLGYGAALSIVLTLIIFVFSALQIGLTARSEAQ